MADKRVSEAVRRVRGSVIEALGKLMGDRSAEARGAAQKRQGEAELGAARPDGTSRRDKPRP